MTMDASISPLSGSTPRQQHSSQESRDSTSIWGRIVSIPSKISSFFSNLWEKHCPTLTPIAERAVKAIGVGVVVGLAASILTGSPLIMIAMGAAGGGGYILGSEIHARYSKA